MTCIRRYSPEPAPKLIRKSTLIEFEFSPIKKYVDESDNGDTSTHPEPAKLISLWTLLFSFDNLEY